MGSDFNKLEAKIEKAKEANQDINSKPDKVDSSMSDGMRAGSEFLAHVFAGCFLGYLVDRFFGTLPWGLIVLCMAGFATGVYSANRAMNKKP